MWNLLVHDKILKVHNAAVVEHLAVVPRVGHDSLSVESHAVRAICSGVEAVWIERKQLYTFPKVFEN